MRSACVGVALALMLAPAASAAPGRLYFSSDRGNNVVDLFSITLDGSAPRQLTNTDDKIEAGSAVSPNGDRVAYSDPDELFAMNADGSASGRVLDGFAEAPSWSPDGGRLAFFGNLGDGAAIYSARPDGSAVKKLAAADAPGWPDYSPDGSRIAYTRNGYIAVVNSDGSNDHVLNGAIQGDQPAWSPDGAHFAFVSTHEDSLGDVYVMNADGTNVRRLTTAYGADYRPTWSPDGSKIAFSANRDGNAELYVMYADGTAQTRITRDSGQDGAMDTEPSWDPSSGSDVLGYGFPPRAAARGGAPAKHGRGPRLVVRCARRQHLIRQRGIRLTVVSARGVRTSVRALAKVPGMRPIKLHSSRRGKVVLRLRLRQQRLSARGLRRHPGKARVRVTGVDGGGRRTTVVRRVVLVP